MAKHHKTNKQIIPNRIHKTHQIFLTQLSSHIRLNKSWTDTIHSHTPIRKLLGIAHCKPNHSTLGSCIIRLTRISNLTHNTGYIYHSSTPLLCSKFEKSLGAIKYSRKVDINDFLPLRGFHAYDETVFGDSSVVDEDIDGAECFGGGVEHVFDFIGVSTFECMCCE